MDTKSDLLTRIRNAIMRNFKYVEAPYSKLSERILEILADEKFIDGYEILEDQSTKFNSFNIKLRYVNGRSAIESLKVISKPGLRKYVQYKDLKSLRGNTGIYIISTSKGVLADRKAKELKVGGELLCSVY